MLLRLSFNTFHVRLKDNDIGTFNICLLLDPFLEVYQGELELNYTKLVLAVFYVK